MRFKIILSLFILTFSLNSKAKVIGPITTNAVVIYNSPKWLKATRVEKVTDRIQSKLEWTTRKINVHWHDTQSEFEKIHNLGPLPRAVTIKSTSAQTIHLGPKVTSENFDWIFGHELVHVIIFQKYRGSIPQWLEEGLANHLAKKTQKVDYKWLLKKPFPNDVTKLTHPFKGTNSDVVYHYIASQAMAEMLDKKCGLENLIRLSVERKMEDYIVTYCEIKDLNKSFQDWVKVKAR